MPGLYLAPLFTLYRLIGEIEFPCCFRIHLDTSPTGYAPMSSLFFSPFDISLILDSALIFPPTSLPVPFYACSFFLPWHLFSTSPLSTQPFPQPAFHSRISHLTLHSLTLPLSSTVYLSSHPSHFLRSFDMQPFLSTPCFPPVLLLYLFPLLSLYLCLSFALYGFWLCSKAWC